MKRIARIAGIILVMAACFFSGLVFEKAKTLKRQLQYLNQGAKPADKGNVSGRWYKSRKQIDGGRSQEENLEKLGTLPYLKGYAASKSAADGVVTYDPDRAFSGATLFCSGHAPVVLLIDMEGNILHSWTVRFEDVWPDPLPFPAAKEHKQFIRKGHLYPDGEILCLFEYIGIVKLDKDSNILWRHTGQNHHDIQVSREGQIYTLGRVEKNMREYPQAPFALQRVFDDLVLVLDAHGNEIKRISLFDAFYRSDHAGFLNFIRNPKDLFHTNSVQLVEEPPKNKGGLFQPGDLLVSIRDLHAIALIDGRSERVKWALTGMWYAQHQSFLLDNGNILLLDNRGGNRGSYFELNRSKVIEVDPLTQQIQWEYSSDKEGKELFYTHWLGYNQRLPNGNTLITDSESGRAFEVTKEGEIVWEFINPHRSGDDQSLVATLYELIRLDPESLPFLNDAPQP